MFHRALAATAMLALASCGPADKYSDVPQPKGEWRPANADPDITDNNILPEFARGPLP